MIGIMIPVYERPEYFQQTINSLLASNLKGCMICIVDDGSKNKELKKIYHNFIIQYIPIIKIIKENNVGMWDSMRLGFDTLIEYGCDKLINLDSDVIVKSNWVPIMDELLEKHSDRIISGFNKSLDINTVKEYDNYVKKTHVGGVSMMFTKETYNERVKQHLTSDLWDLDLSRYLQEKKFYYYVTKPSVVQHIGQIGKNSSLNNYDYADDY